MGCFQGQGFYRKKSSVAIPAHAGIQVFAPGFRVSRRSPGMTLLRRRSRNHAPFVARFVPQPLDPIPNARPQLLGAARTDKDVAGAWVEPEAAGRARIGWGWTTTHRARNDGWSPFPARADSVSDPFVVGSNQNG